MVPVALGQGCNASPPVGKLPLKEASACRVTLGEGGTPMHRPTVSQTSAPGAATHPVRLAGRALVAVLLAFSLAACASAGPNGPNDPGGPLTTLPDDVPPGDDPSGGAVGCVIADRTFDDDVTVPA